MAHSEFSQLTEKELKYELFRALRRHESERAIAILKDSRADPNWQHAYRGRSVLMQALFENEDKVFTYLLSLPQVDTTLTDDNGHTIYYWIRFPVYDAKIDYIAEIIRARNDLARQEIERITREEEASPIMEYEPQPQYSLYLKRRYQLLNNFLEMKKGQKVTYIGTHQEPGERWLDDYYDFKHESGKITSIAHWDMPSTTESYQIFEDILDDVSKTPEEAHSFIHALRDRSQSIRIDTAQKIMPNIPGITYIMPLLLENALRLENADNHFVAALNRLGKLGLDFIEGDQAAAIGQKNHGRRFERVLAKMGSSKNKEKNYQALKDSDPYKIRFTIKRLVELQDLKAIPHLEALITQKNYNVRIAAKKAIKDIQAAHR